MTAISTQTQNTVIATQAESFGVNVWMTFPEAILNHEEVKSLAEVYGFESELPKPSAKKSIKRAATIIAKSNKHVLSRNISENAHSAVMGIVNESVDGETLDYAQGTTIRLNKDNGEVDIKGSKSEEIEALYKSFRESTISTDLRTFCINTLKRYARSIPKRPSGGIYFVPNAYLPVVESLAELISVLGVGKVYIERLYNGGTEKANMWDAAKHEINKQISELMEKVENTGKTSSARIGRSIASLDRKNEDFNEVEEMMALYEEVVGNEFEAEKILNRVAEAREVIADKIITLEKRKSAQN